ncbi:MAG: type II/IV secretion system protein [Candidatus Kerfeldbacteria bacterium]|nr:type II/IV secretion system protein [Candidatus Kerfeldbacteria bacterium]
MIGKTVAEQVLTQLQRDGVLTPSAVEKLRQDATKQGIDALTFLERRQSGIPAETLAKAKATAFHLPYIDISTRQVGKDVINLIPKDFAALYQAVAFQRLPNGELHVALADPSNLHALEGIEFLARQEQLRPIFFVVSSQGLKTLLKKYDSLSEEVEQALEGAETDQDVITSSDESLHEEINTGDEEVIRNAPVSKMVSVMLKHAVEGKASDIHIEPFDKETRVRYRVDGKLHTSILLPIKVHLAIIARIKVLANLKIDETRSPQDGRFRIVVDGHNVDLRVSTLPLLGNREKVVMRILDSESEVLELEKLGFTDHNLQVLLDNSKKSHGMLLVTGPTGSGKSTTLYSLLRILNKEDVNIVTLEDPIEYYMNGVNQSQVNPDVGFTFARGLRSILRQDPDVIMVGEIRDQETAELAIHAGLTGHMVLSTLHTNDALGAIPRLVDMHVEPFLISSAVNVVIAQRLVRRICPYCITTAEIPDGLRTEVKQELALIPEHSFPADIRGMTKHVFKRGKGCARCENSGFKGRVGIIEVIEMTTRLQAIVASGFKAREVLDEARRQGMITMKQDGIIKALRGLTTIEELWTATKV